MSTIGEIGAFLAEETAAAGGLPPAPPTLPSRIDDANGSRPQAAQRN
jgi:hypothetical protein